MSSAESSATCNFCSEAATDGHGNFKPCCQQHWKQLTESLSQKNKSQSKVDMISKHCIETYIGRTSCPERRLIEHNFKQDSSRYDLIALHWTPDWGEIAALEEWLIAQEKLERCRKKLVNEDLSSTGKFTGSWQCLYMRVKWRPGGKGEFLLQQLSAGHTVTVRNVRSLRPADLAVPSREELTLFQINLTNMQAETQLKDYYSRRRETVHARAANKKPRPD